MKDSILSLGLPDMRSTVLVLAIVALGIAAAPQRLAAQTDAPNAAYLELGGSGGLYSLNFERRVGAARLRVGFASWTSGDLAGAGDEDFVTIPLTLSHLRGSGKHHLETGGGVTLGSRKFTSSFDGEVTKSGFATLTGLVGYRYQKPGSGFLFRALFTPLWGIGPEDLAYPSRGFEPSVGISFGAAF